MNESMKQIKIKGDRACALDFNNGLVCWNFKGLNVEVPKELKSGVQQFGMGYEHICVVGNQGELKCGA